MSPSHIAILMVLFFSVAMATDHIVGDDKGWTVDFNYTQWAQDRVFRVGDNLVFNYNNSKHNVFRVIDTEFQNCVSPPKFLAFSTGKDVIPLKTEGTQWYICGIDDHCAHHQMKLAVAILEAPAPSPPPSSNAHFTVSSMFRVINYVVATVAIATIFV